MSNGTGEQRPQAIANTAWLEPPKPPSCARGESRRYVIEQEHWLVCADGSAFGPALIFLGPGVARRVRSHPANWRELCDEALHALSISR